MVYAGNVQTDYCPENEVGAGLALEGYAARLGEGRKCRAKELSLPTDCGL